MILLCRACKERGWGGGGRKRENPQTFPGERSRKPTNPPEDRRLIIRGGGKSRVTRQRGGGGWKGKRGSTSRWGTMWGTYNGEKGGNWGPLNGPKGPPAGKRFKQTEIK